MKFEEKLSLLRKQNFLSQEQLAEKLNVTRQTVSKWELGQSKPDMDTLKKISELFKVNIDLLINDEFKIPINKEIKNPNKREKRKPILYILIIFLIAAIVALAIRLGGNVAKISKEAKEKNGSIFSIFNIKTDDIKKDSFNAFLEMCKGTKSNSLVARVLDEVINSNKKNANHIIEVVFDDESYGTDTNKIKEIKSKINKEYNYEVSFDYDKDGYINKIILQTGEETESSKSEKAFQASMFNNGIESYSGTKSGFFVSILIDHLITSNKKNSDHLIEVIYNNESYGTDTNSIGNIKNKIDSGVNSNYEVSMDYDTLGYINKITIGSK